MNRCYEDLLALTTDPPVWWDEHAVPRWCAFHPSQLDIYADEAALMAIECQRCGKHFLVATCTGQMERIRNALHLPRKERAAACRVGQIAEEIKKDELEWGDPPNMHCCPAGPTMNSVPRQVVQYWFRYAMADQPMTDWTRDPVLERPLNAPWMQDPVDPTA